MTIPRLETDRLLLRGVRAEEHAALARIRAKPDVGKYVGGERDAQDTCFLMMRTRGMWELLGYGFWVVELKDTGEVIGEAGFADHMRGMTPDISGFPEAGWVLDAPYWGKGLTTEAVIATHE